MNEHFDLFFAKYGIEDKVIWATIWNDKKRNEDQQWGWYHIRRYHDGAWLEGYDVQPVIYWGA